MAMFILSLKNNKWFFAFFLVVLFYFCLPFVVGAETSPQIFVKDFIVGDIKDGQISGSFNVWNNENYYINNLNYSIELKRIISSNNLEIIDSSVSKEEFSIPPGRTISKSFKYSFPENIISGEYVLHILVMTERGTSLGWSEKKISLQGKNTFLELNTDLSKVLINNKEYIPMMGVNASSLDSVVALLEVKNPGDAITVVPSIKIFNRQINMSVFKEYQDALITFAKGETRIVQLQMPKIDVPESYLAEIRFLKDGEPVSGIQYFRWVVQGVSAKVLYVKADKDAFSAGESINLIVQSIGPADGSDAGQGNLYVEVYNIDGNLVGKTSKEVELGPSVVTTEILIPVKNDLVSPKISVRLMKDGKVLDDTSSVLPIYSENAKKIQASQEDKKSVEKFISIGTLYGLLGILVVLLLVIGFFIFKFKFRKK